MIIGTNEYLIIDGLLVKKHFDGYKIVSNPKRIKEIYELFQKEKDKKIKVKEIVKKEEVKKNKQSKKSKK